LLATLHFPRYRLAGGRMRVWDQPGSYLSDFLARAGADWHHSEWDFRNVIAAGVDKVHLDVQFTRYRADSSLIGSFPLAMDRYAGRLPLGRGGSVELRGLTAGRPQEASWPNKLGRTSHHRPPLAFIDGAGASA